MTTCRTVLDYEVIINYTMDNFYIVDGVAYIDNEPYGADIEVCEMVSPDYALADPADVTKTLIWQYDEAENLQQIVEKKQEWLEANHNQFWADWTRDVFDLRTANDFGCSVWATILGVSFEASATDGAKAVFGFAPYRSNFFGSNFSATAGNASLLPTETKRLVLQLRYLYLTSRGTVSDINRALKLLFTDAYISDNGNMTVTINFVTPATSEAMYILENYDVLPIPSSVELIY